MSYLVAATVGSLLAVYLLFPLAVRLIFRAPRRPEKRTPAAAGLPFELVAIPARNACLIRGWLISQPRADAPLVIALHGWGGNAECMLPLASPLYRAGLSILLLDARNHGMSDGDGFSSMVKFAEDFEAAYVWAMIRTGDKVPVSFVGHSVGGAAALLAASRLPGVAAVVSISSFAHPAELMERVLASRGLGFYPLTRWVLRYVERKIGAAYGDIAPVRTIGEVGAPVLIIHGEADRSVPVSDADAIYRSPHKGPVELWRLPGVGHDPAAELEREAGRLVEFFTANLADK